MKLQKKYACTSLLHDLCSDPECLLQPCSMAADVGAAWCVCEHELDVSLALSAQ